MKKIFKDWTIFEKSLLCFSVVIVSLVGILTKSSFLPTITSIVGIITALLLAKGKNLGQTFGILIVILYSTLSFKNRFYGEVIVYVCLMLPMYIMGTISWIRHQNKKTNTVDVNTIKVKEWIIAILVSIITFVLIYLLLKQFNTNQLFISSLSVIDSLFAVYLSFRRSKYSFLLYVVNDIVLILLWGIPVLNGQLNLIPILLNPIINMINDSYEIYNWKRLEKIQKK